MNRQTKRVGIEVSAYDRAAGWVVSGNILIGFAVALLFLIWLSPGSEPEWTHGKVAKIFSWGKHYSEPRGGLVVERPGEEELDEEDMSDEVPLLDEVTHVVATQVATLDAMPMVDGRPAAGQWNNKRRVAVDLPQQDDIVPRGERWRIRYNANSIATYAQQLDYFQIELGAVGGQKRVDYAFNVQKTRPDARRGAGDAEKRMYMLWKNGTLKRFDEQLLRAAGIETAGRLVAQFYPEVVEDQLARLEMKYAVLRGKTSVKQIKNTVFGVQRAGEGFEYTVLSQRYRDAESEIPMTKSQ